MSWLDEFTVLPVKIDFQAVEDFSLPPFKGSTFRGGFGYSFKNAVCVAGKRPCEDCILYRACVYSYVFETPRPNGANVMRKYQKIPHPFVLRPPLNRDNDIRQGQVFSLGSVLIGKAVEYLPYFVLVFEVMGQRGLGSDRGVCSLVRAHCGREVVYEPDGKPMTGVPPLKGKDIFDRHPQAPKNITLEFTTPLRLVRNRRILDEIGFQDVFRTLLRRLALLSTFHCKNEPDVDFRNIIAKSAEVRTVKHELRWQEQSRYSTRQNARMSIGGLVGQVTFEGELEPFYPYLVLGQFLHVGKNTSFGLGQYILKSSETGQPLAALDVF